MLQKDPCCSALQIALDSETDPCETAILLNPGWFWESLSATSLSTPGKYLADSVTLSGHHIQR